MTNIAFVDCETTHLDAEVGEAWEVAVILREPDGSRFTDTEYVWQFAVDRTTADPEALRIGRFHERHLVDPTWGAAWTGPGPVVPLGRTDAVTAIVNVLSGAVLVGSNPAFDDRFLRKLLGPGSAQWHPRPYDIVQLAAAKVGVQAAGPLPWRSHTLSRAVAVEPPSEEAAHTALGDARWARDVYDAAMVREKFPLSWEGRANHALGLYTQAACELDDVRRQLRAAQAAPSQAVMTGETDTAFVPRTERSHWVDIANALNAAHDAGMPVGIDLDGTLTDHNAWSVIWDPTTERWAVAGYEDEGDETPCTCTFGETCDQCAGGDNQDEEGEEFEETGDSDGDVLRLISEIASSLQGATDSGEYHAASLIYDLANGRTTIADARGELADIEFGHV
ncbi:3'-5' exonuclease [Streptomyces sp. NBC_00443]|uniref:3'-5' exonuclease n=1 Tax=Streptomyces sp. NBC_00443 TaxID=2975743 RepID=UPI002E23B393